MRAPFQILAIPFVKENDEYYYAVFKRRDLGIWQFIAGGGEGEETPDEAVKREANEEAAIDPRLRFVRLSSATTIPAAYAGGMKWGDIVMIPEISFGIEMLTKEFTLSHEHAAYEWLKFSEAMELLKYDSNKSALWELDYRLKNGLDAIADNIESVQKYYSATN